MDRIAWCGVKEISEYLGVTPHRIYQLTADRKIPFYKRTGKLLFRPEEIDDWLMEGRRPCRKPVLKDDE